MGIEDFNMNMEAVLSPQESLCGGMDKKFTDNSTLEKMCKELDINMDNV